MSQPKRKKLMAVGGAGLGIAAGSFAVGVLNPFTTASAQDSPTTTTPPAAETTTRTLRMDQVLSALVADGTLTQPQADKVKAAYDAARPQGEGLGRHRGGKVGGVRLDDVATFLGTDVESLHTQLHSGQSLAAIAGDRADELITYLVDAANKRIDEAVAAGNLTAERAAELKTSTQQKVTDMVNNVRPAKPMRNAVPTS